MRIVVKGRPEKISKHAEELRRSIDKDCKKQIDKQDFANPEERALAYITAFRNHELFPKYGNYMGKAHDVFAATKKLPFHTKKWHKQALKKWEKVLKATEDCKHWIKENKQNIPSDRLARMYGSIPMHDTLIKHSKEEIDFHRKMISLLGGKK